MLIVAIKEDPIVSHSLQSASLLLRGSLPKSFLPCLECFHSAETKGPFWQLLFPHNCKVSPTISLHLVSNGDNKLKWTHCINTLRPDPCIFPFLWCHEANLLWYDHTSLSFSCFLLLWDRIMILKCHEKSCMKSKDNWHRCYSSRL